MTDKVELKSCHEVIDTVDVVNIESIFHGKPIDPDILTVVMKDGKRLYCDEVCPVDSLQEEPVNEFMNTESMIESYKQRLISQTNGVKDSPLIDMCLASYKHGINEILDTLNLSNVQRTVKKLKEPVSEDLEEAANNALNNVLNAHEIVNVRSCLEMFKYGAKWQKEQDQSTIELAEDHAMLAGMEKMKEQMMKNIWKPADGEDLPEIDREVIALLDRGKVVFAHRPPEFWDGKDIITGKVTRNYVERYDKGMWNIPNVKYWLDVELPKEIEL